MKKLKASARDFWIDHIWIDYVIAAAIVGAHFALALTWPWVDLLGGASAPDRRAVYSAAAIVVSLLGSFSAVAIGQLSSAKGGRADALREVGGLDLAKNWRSIFRTALLCALVALTALLLDPSIPPVLAANAEPPPVPGVIRWLFEVTLMLAIVRFVRLSALFVEVMEVASMGNTNGQGELADAPTPNLDWARKRKTSNGS